MKKTGSFLLAADKKCISKTISDQQHLIEALRESQQLLSREKSEKEVQRNYFLQREDQLSQAIKQLETQLEEAKDNAGQHNTYYKELVEQISENMRLRTANRTMIERNEAELKAIDIKYQTEITYLQQQISQLQTELAIQRESNKQLLELVNSPVPGIEEFLESNGLQAVIDFPINNPAYTLQDTAQILLLKANVCASLLRLEEAEQYFMRSIATLEYKENLVSWSNYLFTKKDWDQCRLITLKALAYCFDSDTRIDVVTQLLSIYLNTNNNGEAIKLGESFLNGFDSNSVAILKLHTLYLALAANLINAFDKEKGRAYCEKIINTPIPADNEERDTYLLLHTYAFMALGDTYYCFYQLSDPDYEINPEKGLYYFLEAGKTLSDITNKDQESCIYLLLGLNTRLALLQKNDQAVYMSCMNISNNLGDYIYKNKNEVLLEFAANQFSLCNYYQPTDAERSIQHYALLLFLKVVIETGSDINRDQHLFYINSWLLAHVMVSEKSWLLEEMISKILHYFEMAAPKAHNEFLYHGVTFLRFVYSYYHNRGDERAYGYYKNLLFWLEDLAEKVPKRFIADISDLHINQSFLT